MLPAIAGFVAVLAAFAAMYQWCGRLVLTYDLTDRGIDIVALRVVAVMRIPYRDIESIQAVSFRDSLRLDPFVLRIGNRLVGETVVVSRKSGWFRRVLITPDDPSAFVAHAGSQVSR